VSRALVDWQTLATAVEVEVESGLEDLKTALRIPSISARNQNLEESAGFLSDLLRRDGWSVEVVRVGDNPVVFAEIGPREPSVVVYGHHDVQPVDPEAAWTTPPFEPELRDGRLYGRGTADNKGQFFGHIFAVRAIQRAMGELPAGIRLVLDGQEEMGSPEMPRFVELMRDRLQGASFCFTADGPARVEGRPQVVFGVRGVLKLRLTVTTSATDLHSGNWGNLAPNAALRMAQILAAIKGMDGRVRIPGFYEDVRPPTPAEREAMAAIPFDPDEAAASIGASALDGPEDLSAMERVMFWPTFNVTGISSGYTGPGFKTVLPSQAVAQIDVRLVADQDPDRMYALIRDHLSEFAPEATLEKLGHYLPSRTPLDSPGAELVIAAVRRGFEIEPLLVPCASGSSPEAVFAQGLGIPAFHSPYGQPDQRNHAPDENLRYENLVAGARTSAALILEVAVARTVGS
jgi:acetylornithine deacetylase/succinyl-diaminopimelate desuccinylase-like protein